MRRRSPVVRNPYGKPPLKDTEIIFGYCVKCGAKIPNTVKQWRGLGPISLFRCAKCKKEEKKEKQKRIEKEKEEMIFRSKYGEYTEEVK